MKSLYISVIVVLSAAACALAVEEDAGRVTSKQPTPAAEQALAAVSRPAGLEIAVVASEPLVVNPVAFCFDEPGRLYVVETFRQKRGVEDNRSHAEWLDDDLAAQTVADRAAYYKKHLGEAVGKYAQHGDRVRQLRDTNGDRRYDTATLFAGPYQEIIEGTAAGVLAVGDDILLTNIPRVWRLRDTDDDGRADEHEVLHEGYGVRTAFRGHDMHGLCRGPDGRVYFSIGDRGYHVETEGRTLHDPESGAVFRCNPDGSGLEVFATGLRNPQELAFNDAGDLFTGDNNSDSGDRARWVHVVEGGDTGWRMAYQYLGDRGPFNREKVWHLAHAEQSAAIVPPLAHVGSGPSGLVCYPGTGLGEAYRDTFFLCDFRGGSANSSVLAIAMKPRGASYEVTKAETWVRNVLATDVDFGPDGGLYISDWVDGWEGTGAGRIYRVSDPQHAESELVRQVQALLAADFAERDAAELVSWLAHADRRVRLKAQFALVERTADAELRAAAADAKPSLARIHAVWGLGQLARRQDAMPETTQFLIRLLDDSEPEIRAQAARVLGDARVEAAAARLIELLADESARVRYFAAIALGRIGAADAVEPLLAMLTTNNDADPVLRHAGIFGLAGASSADELVDDFRRRSPAVRRAIVVALRRQHSPRVAELLGGSDPLIVLEAARAIHDEPIRAATEALALLIERPTQSDPLMRRVLAANNRLGDAAGARRLAQYAAQAGGLMDRRRESLDLLAGWATPSNRDSVLGMWRPLAPRDAQVARAALQSALPALLSSDEPIRAQAATVAAKLGIQEVGPALVELFNSAKQSGRSRADALVALAGLEGDRAAALLAAALQDQQALVRAAARRLLAGRDATAAMPLLRTAIGQGEMVERQDALDVLAELKSPAADEAIVAALDQLVAGQLPADTALDVVEAAERRSSPAVQARLAKHKAALGEGPLAEYGVCLTGGDASRGRAIFFTRTEVSCVRCHQIDRVGGDVGPDLSKIADKNPREYLLEALVDPNAKIAKGFATQNIATVDGKVYTGIVRHEDDEVVRLITADGKLIEIPQDEIDQRAGGKSAMPDDVIKKLSRREVRDLLEFLAGRK
jgi:quinoprotein glucose dehydrogenase